MRRNFSWGQQVLVLMWEPLEDHVSLPLGRAIGRWIAAHSGKVGPVGMFATIVQEESRA